MRGVEGSTYLSRVPCVGTDLEGNVTVTTAFSGAVHKRPQREHGIGERLGALEVVA